MFLSKLTKGQIEAIAKGIIAQEKERNFLFDISYDVLDRKDGYFDSLQDRLALHDLWGDVTDSFDMIRHIFDNLDISMDYYGAYLSWCSKWRNGIKKMWYKEFTK